uniref:Uncharacterized protein n=1 Tax=Picea sitchensis TaxID=3332 RepID=A0A6B9XWK9_PICSI|nr:hypothetical protein Q903MT_gene5480 [Picea sitchensis]
MLFLVASSRIPPNVSQLGFSMHSKWHPRGTNATPCPCHLYHETWVVAKMTHLVELSSFSDDSIPTQILWVLAVVSQVLLL